MNDWKTVLKGLLQALLILAITGLFIWFVTTILHVQEVALLATLILLPLVVYLVVTGRLQEFGLIKLNNEAKKTLLGADAARVDADRDTWIEAKGNWEQIQERVPLAANYRNIILTVTLKRKGYYKSEALLGYLRGYSRYPGFKFLVILEPDEKVFAYLLAWRVIQILEYEIQEYMLKKPLVQW